MAGQELLSDQNFRLDGRKPQELRRIQCNLGVFNQADGSAYLEQGNTKVLATVYGPHECRMKSKALHDKAFINCQYSMATFSTGDRKRRPRGDKKSQEITENLVETFEAVILTNLYPLSQIDIYVEVLQADGSNFSVCVNAASLALIDAGIAVKDMVTCCSSTIVNSSPMFDLNYLEESTDGVEFIVAVLSRTEELVFMEVNGKTHEDHLEKVSTRPLKVNF